MAKHRQPWKALIVATPGRIPVSSPKKSQVLVLYVVETGDMSGISAMTREAARNLLLINNKKKPPKTRQSTFTDYLTG